MDQQNLNFGGGNDINNDLVERIYDYGNGNKFHSMINKNVQVKKFKPIFTTDFEPKEFQEQIENEIKNSKKNDPVPDEKPSEMDKQMKKSLLTKKFESKSKQPIPRSQAEAQENYNYERRQQHLGQEVDSIAGFKLVNPLPPSSGERIKGIPSNILRHKVFNKADSDFDQAKSTKGFTGFNSKEITIKPTTTIINLKDDKGVNYLINKNQTLDDLITDVQANINLTLQNQIDTNQLISQVTSMPNTTDASGDKSKKDEQSDEYQYMNSINNFIKEAFEGKDYKINFVYYLPSNKENYYELRLTEFSLIAREKIYYTLSAKGLTVYEDKQPKEFIKLSEWIIEREGYNYVANINFFKNFKIWRIIKIWRKNIFKQKKIAYQNELATKLLFNNKDYNERLCQHKANCNGIMRLKILNLEIGFESHSFDAFKSRQENEREKLKKKLNVIHNQSEVIFVEGIKKIFSNLHKTITTQNNESNYSDNKKNKLGAIAERKDKDEADKNQDNGMVNEDSIVGFENFSFKYKMMIKTECMNFIKLAFLFDYVLLDCLRRMYLTSMEDSIDKLKEFNVKETPKELKENVLTKRDEYVKPIVHHKPGDKTTPYFVINCLLRDVDKHKIDPTHLIREEIRTFEFKFSREEDFKPAAHIEVSVDDEFEIKNAEGKDTIFYEKISNPSYYFTEYEPSKEEIKDEFSNQIHASVESLKVQCWKGHPEFKKYLPYLGDYDDRYGDWDNDEKVTLDPSAILCTDDLFQDRDTLIQHEIDLAYKKCDNYMKMMNPYFQLHWDILAMNNDILLEENIREADEVFKILFNVIEKNIKTLQKHAPFEDDIGMIKLNHEQYMRKDLIKAQENLVLFIKDNIPDLIKKRLKLIEKWLLEMHKKVKGKIESPRDFLDKTSAKDELEKYYMDYERRINSIDSIMSLLKKKNFENITTEDIGFLGDINNSKYKLKIAWDEMNETLGKTRNILKEELEKKDIPILNQKAQDIENIIDNPADPRYIRLTLDKANIIAYLEELTVEEKKCKDLLDLANTYNEFFTILDEATHAFDEVKRTANKIKILKQLWTSLSEFDEQIEKEKKKLLKEVNPDDIIDKVKEYQRIGKRAERTFIQDSKALKGTAIEELLVKVNQFEESMQVVKDLSSKDLQRENSPSIPKEMINSYCDRIHKLFTREFLDSIDYTGDIPIDLQKGNYNLQYLLEIGADKQQKKINQIVTEARSCNELFVKWREDIQTKMNSESVTLIESQFKEYFTLKDEDALIARVEDLQASLNHIFSNKYFKSLPKKPIDEMKLAKEQMEVFLDTLEEWKIFQKKFMYIASIILSNADFNKKVSDSGFEEIDKDFKSFLSQVRSGFNNIIKMNDKKFKNKFSLKDNNRRIEEVQQRIEMHLTSLRNDFPRFYLISNDDLLFMLANSKAEHYDKVKPYLQKLFDDIVDLKFMEQTGQTSGKNACGLISSTGEEFPFYTPAKIRGEKHDDHNEKEVQQREIKLKKFKIGDNIEEWLKSLEENMTTFVSEHLLCRDNDAIFGMEFQNYVNKLPSQVIAVLSHINFTLKTEMAISKFVSDKDAFQEHFDAIDKEIKLFASIVNRKEYNENTRRIISNYITHYVHNKEICRELAGEDYVSVTDFIWQKVLRAYIVIDEKQAIASGVIKIQQLNASFNYGNEYMGPARRLVISGLTDRVWLTITTSLHIKSGCSLGGPAGTGKTETTKDLAKFLGYQCFVFNCSEQITFKILGNIFCGLCKHKYGIFACLDEFNRINVEVLSVVAQYLLNIKLGLLDLEPDKVVKITIIREIELRGNLGVFITMNPTYSGRTELPDNLKSLFRPISMMIPDFQTIAEVKLYSEGFTTSDKLAKKLHRLYELAGKQLSQQDHYDFTLRTVGSVLTIAGNLKRDYTGGKDQDAERKDEENMLIKALKDANFPKFLDEDTKLFKALLSDLFPESEVHDILPDDLIKEITKIIQRSNREVSPFYIYKCIQLFDIVTIRLGVCLVGPAGTGKSTVISLVSEGMKNLRLDNNPDPKYKDVEYSVINPKSISMGELFGQENEETKTFVYGIATDKIKEALEVKDPQDKHRWVVFDGPIDTIWIENLNSVLDDSMLLCLSNGERIKLMNHIKLLFEVEDLSQASLATVSRLGIVYVGRSDEQWQVVYKTWIKTYFKDESILTKELIHNLEMLFANKMADSFENLPDLAESIPIMPIKVQCCQSTCAFLEIHLNRENGFIGSDSPGLDNIDNINRLRKKLVYCFGLSLAWGTFACVLGKASHKVEGVLRSQFNEIKIENTVILMENKFNPEKTDLLEKYSIQNYNFDYQEGMSFYSIFIPTIDTVRYSEIIESLIKKGKHVFVTGETGVGKTAVIINIIKKLLATDDYVSKQMNFSATTTSEKTQESIEDNLEKRRGKAVLGGKNGRKLIMFIDDINMPEPTKHGSHPPIELLRQLIDNGGFYDRPKFFKKSIEEYSMLVCGGPPIGGRSKLTDRFNRHMAIINFPQPNKTILTSIFETILRSFFIKMKFDESVRKPVEFTLATIDLFETVIENFKPIPAKFHYIFNVRDVSRVFKGLMLADPKYLRSFEKVCKLWLHESYRVFSDRMNNEEDVNFFSTTAINMAKLKLNMKNWAPEMFIKNGPLYFGEIHKEKLDDDEIRPYELIDNYDILKKQLNMTLDQFNSDKENASIKMQLNFFNYAISHILRITRVLRMPRGNMVLIGHGGTGKQSLARFASYAIDRTKVFTFNMTRDIKVARFRNEIKPALKYSGIYSNQSVILLTDNNIVANFILEDINNLLNNGEIPNLYDSNDQAEILSNLPPDKDIVTNTRKNLHVIFCTSPVGDTLKIRFRKFPALINCCVLDWYMNWPKEALIACCTVNFEELNSSKNIGNSQVESLVKVSSFAHQSVEELTEKCFHELGRIIYVTPKTFLDMNNVLVNLLFDKEKEAESYITKLSDGLKKLNKTREDIKIVEKQLEIIAPQLIENEKEAKEKAEVVRINQEEIEKKSEYIRDKKIITNELVRSITEDNDKIMKKKKALDEELAEGWSLVERNLNSTKILELSKQKFNNPKICVIIEAVFFAMEGEKINNTEFNNAFMTNKTRFLNFKEEISDGKIKESTMIRVKKYFDEYIPTVYAKEEDKKDKNNISLTLEEKIKKVGDTFNSMYVWLKAIISYWELDIKQIKPMTAELEKKGKEKAEKQAELDSLTSDLDKFQTNIKHLEEESNRLSTKIKELKDESELNSTKKKNATKLIGLLGSEGERWKEQLKKLSEDMTHFVGNIFISAVYISYLAPFPGNYRRQQLYAWKQLCEDHNLSVSKDFSLQMTMSDPVQIRDWNMSGLPSDNVSIENTIMLFNSTKNALLIDPQMQANEWLKKHFKNTPQGIKVFKAEIREEEKKKFVNSFIELITQDSVILLEGLGDKIDPLFDNLMSKSYYGDVNNKKVDFNGQSIDYNDDFKLFFTTKLPSPHYPPEYYLKLNIINFTVTLEGLSEQLLGDVFRIEKEESYVMRDSIIKEMGMFKLKLKEAADFILDKLNAANENTILTDEELISTLENNKERSIEVAKKVERNTEIERDIDLIREVYTPVARRGSLLYFVIVDLSHLDPMYQVSLKYFKTIYLQSIAKEKNTKVEKDIDKVEILINTITRDMFSNIKRGIFERHKTLYSLLIITAIKKDEYKITPDEWALFVKGPDAMPNLDIYPNPDKDYFSDLNWASLVSFAQIYRLADFVSHITDNLKSYVNFYKTCTELSSYTNFPYTVQKNFMKLILTKIFKPQLIPNLVIDYIKEELGEFYITNTPQKIEDIYKESTCTMPIIFILSQGADPTASLLKFKDECFITNEEGESVNPGYKMISLGQGMETEAKESIYYGLRTGTWIILSNCHLFESFMPELASIIQNVQEDELPPGIEEINPNFRLWLTSQQNKHFPVSVLQSSLKMTTEPPNGIRNNILKFYDDITDKQLVNTKKPDKLPKLMFSLAIFHSVLQDRKKYGEMGFNKRYDFNITDFDTSIELIKAYIDNTEEEDLPWDDIRYLVGRVNYEGRITDDFDKITMKAILEHFLCDNLFEENQVDYTKSGSYLSRHLTSVDEYKKIAMDFPSIDEPEIFGLNENAEIVYQLHESSFINDNLIMLMPKSGGGGGGKSSSEVVMEKLINFIFETPMKIDRRENRHNSHEKTYDNDLHHSLTIVMDQEIEKYNKLLTYIKQSLENLKLGIEGTISMSNLSDELFMSLYVNKVPLQWEAISYTSTKPLTSWFADLKERCEYICKWITSGHPSVHWLSGLFYPKGFITGVLQNHARETKIPVSDIIFDFQVLNSWEESIGKGPSVSIFIYNIHLLFIIIKNQVWSIYTWIIS